MDYPESPLPFDAFFADRDSELDNYGELAKVLYFWMSVYSLKQEGAIDARLARDLFSSQYADWEEAIRPLYDKTKEAGAYAPDWFIFMNDNNMKWLGTD